MTDKPQEILDFWFVATPASKRYVVDPELDAEIRARFLNVWHKARAGDLEAWEGEAQGALALIILFDQFSRNMFRGSGEAFSCDARALGIAKRAVARRFDLELGRERQMFFYMPYMHSENLADQDECIRLCAERRGDEITPESYAARHRDVIARFGRFPARNRALGRENTAEEEAFLRANPSGL
jgi:uncharacterized protein (DUF924 family)